MKSWGCLWTCIILNCYVIGITSAASRSQRRGKDKPYGQYNRRLLEKFGYKDYLAAIFENEKTRQDFGKFLNAGLTDRIKEDMKALEIHQIVDDQEMPSIMFTAEMDTWLGVLPEWKRWKKFMFTKLEEYITRHPSVLNNVRIFKPRMR